MADVVVTVPMGMWEDWIEEGDLPGEEAEYDSHFWLYGGLPDIKPGERVYIVAHGKLRGYAPLVRVESHCRLRYGVGCLVRQGGAEAVTIDEPIRGFRGWRERWWKREDERPFPAWMKP
jgi:hypothetical protein